MEKMLKADISLWKITLRLGLAFLLFCFIRPAVAAHLPPAAGDTITVNAAKPETSLYQPFLEFTGTLAANHGITVKAETSGRVTKIFFTSGQYVEEGAPLLQVYPAILEAQVKLQEAKVKLSKMNFSRYQKLLGKDAISPLQYDQAKAQLETDQAALVQMNAQLAQTFIRAPFSGYLGISRIDLGDYLTPGQAVVNLQQINVLLVKFSVPERFVNQLHVGESIHVQAQANGKKIFSGEIIAKESLIDPATRTLTVEGKIPNPNNELIPGSFVEVKVLLDKPKQMLFVPQTAIMYSEQGEYVYKIVDGKAAQVYVTLGKREGSNVYVTNGLVAEDQIVIVGSQKLYPGAKVQVVS